MPRLSRGCLRCRQRRVKCDETRPSCLRCVTRDEACVRYSDESDLIFRHETEKTVQRVRNREAVVVSSSSYSARSSESRRSNRARSKSVDSGHGKHALFARAPRLYRQENTEIQSPLLRLMDFNELGCPAEADIIADFFNKYVLSPCGPQTTPGFLEHLPSMFQDAKAEGRIALRHAVRAAAFAEGASMDDSGKVLARKSLESYGLALSALQQSLSEKGRVPDDYDLMAVVLLDIYETLHLPESGSKGSHAQGMAHILRLRGHGQFSEPRGWSLFRVAHHRVHKLQLVFLMGSPLKDFDVLLESLFEVKPFRIIRVEGGSEISSTLCVKGRAVLSQLKDGDISVGGLLGTIETVKEIEFRLASRRAGPEWVFDTILRSDINGDAAVISDFPETIELHSDTWSAYEWNYHRTSRIVVKEQIIKHLDKALAKSNLSDHERDAMTKARSDTVSVILTTTDEILGTVPQSFGDIDSSGRVRGQDEDPPRLRGMGAYLLLWPIKVLRKSENISPVQKKAALDTYERIREYTGMKLELEEFSTI